MSRMRVIFRVGAAMFLCLCARVSCQAVSTEAKLDWKQATIYSTLSLDAKKSAISLPSGRTAALRMLEMEMPGQLKELFFSIVVDSSTKLGNAVESGSVSLSELDKRIYEGSSTPPWMTRDLASVSMSHTVSIPSIGSLFVKHTVPYEPKQPFDTTATRTFTGIIIDAQGSLPVHGEYTAEKLLPALFPKIWNANMELLYERNMVEPAVAIKNSIVMYTDSRDESLYRDRIGNDPLRIRAREVFGNYRTDPIISELDYLRILSDAGNRKLLKEGRVVIICDADSLEPANLGPNRNENYYFTRTEIQRALEQKPVPRMEFTDTWEGMKLLVYDIRFVADKAEILEEEKGRLDLIASALLLAGPNAKFRVEGHTASVGKPAGEKILSLERAKTIARELSARGISPENISYFGMGGEKPVGDNGTEAGRALNRRVEITINTGD